ncbi:MAG TPA: prepilin peptidase [Fimbriimonadaceae bacterium]|nr:prepilin peptidase [Fimbriimonadaceae bacterium]
MFPAWTWIVGFWIGAAVGSFLNVVIYRLPRGLSIYKPKHSFCPACKHQLSGPDLVPILSWLFLRGKCRHCGARVSPRYMVVEVINGAIWAVVWYQMFVLGGGPGGMPSGVAVAYAFAYATFASALVAAIFTDLAHYVIPDQVNAFMFVVGVGLNIALIAMGRPEAWLWGVPSSLAGAFVGWGVLWGIAFLGRIAFRKDAMGHGDIKMARGIGAVLLPAAALMSFGVAVVLGAVLGIALVGLRNRARRAEPEVEDETPWEPESIGSLLKCGLGYLLLLDVFGLAWPRFYESWFGENPYSVEEFEEEPEVELTMIPFGPYLAAGALVALLAHDWLFSLWAAYVKKMGLG